MRHEYKIHDAFVNSCIYYVFLDYFKMIFFILNDRIDCTKNGT